MADSVDEVLRQFDPAGHQRPAAVGPSSATVEGAEV